MELLNAFGIDYKILIAQLFNFAVLFFVLYKVGYGPILKFLNDRKKRIEDGIKMAEEAELKLKEAVSDKNAIIIEAKKEAADIIAKASDLAQKKNEEVVEEIKKDVALIVEREKRDIQVERAQTLKDVKNEVADLIAVALEKILEEKMVSEKDKELIKKAIKIGK